MHLMGFIWHDMKNFKNQVFLDFKTQYYIKHWERKEQLIMTFY